MSTADPDSARTPRASDSNPNIHQPRRRFAPGSESSAPGYGEVEQPFADPADAPLRPIGAGPGSDVWSNEPGTRRFQRVDDAYPMVAGVVDVAAPPKRTRSGPSVATQAYETTMPAPLHGATSSPSAFVTDALSDLSGTEMAPLAPPPPRREPARGSVPPPGFE